MKQERCHSEDLYSISFFSNIGYGKKPTMVERLMESQKKYRKPEERLWRERSLELVLDLFF